MNEFACQYTIVRFLPYVETGEFANIGVILACPETGFLAGKFMPLRRTKRITDFFDDLNVKIYREALRFVRTEVTRMRQFVGAIETDRERITAAAFHELARPREALIRFAGTRALLANDPKQALDDLFAHFVERDFATKEYQEQLLNRGVAKLLSEAKLRTLFATQVVGDDTVKVKFPFLSTRTGIAPIAIKPLHLAKDEPSKIIEHGGQWVERIRRLKRHNKLPTVLFPVQLPSLDGKQYAAAMEIVTDLTQLGAEIAGAEDREAILNFADRARPAD